MNFKSNIRGFKQTSSSVLVSAIRGRAKSSSLVGPTRTGSKSAAPVGENTKLNQFVEFTNDEVSKNFQDTSRGFTPTKETEKFLLSESSGTTVIELVNASESLLNLVMQTVLSCRSSDQLRMADRDETNNLLGGLKYAQRVIQNTSQALSFLDKIVSNRLNYIRGENTDGKGKRASLNSNLNEGDVITKADGSRFKVLKDGTLEKI